MRTRNELYSLSPRVIWGALKRQPASFWFVCIYLFFEYVRPQQVYKPIEVLPYARITLILALVSFLLERRTLHFRIFEVLLTIFSVIVVASSVTAFDSSHSYEKLPDFFSWVLIYVLIANTVDTEERFLIFMLSFLLYSFKMSQFGTRSWAQDGFAFRNWGTTGAPGWFQNSGEFGIQMCIFLPLAAEFILALREYWPRWLRWAAWAAPVTAITGIVASSSRGALVGLGGVALWAIWTSPQKVRALTAVIVLAGLVYAITPSEQKSRFQQVGVDPTSVSRTTMWKNGLEMMRDYPILGIGYDNWTEYHDINYGGHGLLVHNSFIQAGSELGYTGLLAFLAMTVAAFVINRRTRLLANRLSDRGKFMFYMARGLDGSLVGLFVSGSFISVLYYPFFWINFAMTVALNNAALNALRSNGSSPLSNPSTGGSSVAVSPLS
ncbi:MAG: O-antigen ligase family protein [Gemmatimonadota bacterium]|nr:O-antigen ligase family protein [Gemmatimonadota bacterium]